MVHIETMAQAAQELSLTTPRLLLRFWREEDAPALRQVLDRSDAHLRPFIPFMRHEPRSLEQTQLWLTELRAQALAGRYLRFGLWLKDGRDLVGETMLLDRDGNQEWELGYWQDVEAGGQGYATEAAQCLVAFAFERLKCSQLKLVCDDDNSRSIRMAQKLGFNYLKSTTEEETLLQEWVLLAKDFRTVP